MATALLSFSHPASPVSAAVSSTLGYKPTQANTAAATVSKSMSSTPADTGEIRAFAKLQGRNWTFYVQKVSVVVGRLAKPGSPVGENSAGNDIDVHLGDLDCISRKHLRIDYAGAQGWEMYCFGKTGVTVDGKHYDPFCQPIQLSSKSLINVGGVEFYFLLPIGVSSGSAADEVFEKPRTKIPIVQPIPMVSLAVPDDVNAIKPYLSYACLIAEAINTSPEQKLTLSDIYKYLMDKHPYFRHTKNGWQNSIRHNLSLNKAFMKVPRSGGEPGKGMFWVIDPNHRASLESKSYTRRTSNNAGSSRARASSAQTTNVTFNPYPTAPSTTINLNYAGRTSVPAVMPPVFTEQPVPIRAMSTISIPRAMLSSQSPAHNMLLEAAEALEAEDFDSDDGPISDSQSVDSHLIPTEQQQQTFHPQPSRPFIFNGINTKF